MYRMRVAWGMVLAAVAYLYLLFSLAEWHRASEWNIARNRHPGEPQ